MKGPVPGFSKDVNDALLAASTLVHFKATGLLGFAITLAGIIITNQPTGGIALTLHFVCILLLVASACSAGAAIYPVKHTRRGGNIFWGDIVLHKSAAEYTKSLEPLLSPEDVDREYAFMNYRLSQVLDTKYSFIRWAICLLMAGCALAGASRIF